MKEFEKPEISVIEIEEADIIMASGEDCGNNRYDTCTLGRFNVID